MTYVRFNPAWEMQNIACKMNKLMKQAPDFIAEHKERAGYFPAVDIIEEPEAIKFHFEIPGIEKENVNLSINDENILTIKGEKKYIAPEGVSSCKKRERYFGEFTRAFQLPKYVDPEKISAKYTNGVLIVEIAKKISVSPKENEVFIN